MKNDASRLPRPTRSDQLQSVPPYGKTPRSLLREPSISRGAKVLFAILDDHADRATGIAFPSRRRIAQYMGLKPRQISTYIAELRDAGWIDVRSGEGGSSVYRLRFVGPMHSTATPLAADCNPPCSTVQPPLAVDCRLSRTSEQEPTNQKDARERASSSESWKQELEGRPGWLLSLIAEFVEYRRQLRKPYKTTLGIKQLAKRLEGWGPDIAREAVELAMANEWQGVQEPKPGRLQQAEPPQRANASAYEDDDGLTLAERMRRRHKAAGLITDEETPF